MKRSSLTLSIGRMLLLAAILTLGIAAGARPAGATEAACTDTATRYPMLIGSGYEGTPCETADTACTDTATRYPMLIGSGYEGTPCADAVAAGPLDTAARKANRATLGVAAEATTSATWHETMLDGSGYEGHAIETAHAG